MEIVLQLLDELDDVAGVIRLAAPGLLTALAGLVLAVMVGAVWLWLPEFTLAAFASGATILCGAAAVRLACARHVRDTGQSLST